MERAPAGFHHLLLKLFSSTILPHKTAYESPHNWTLWRQLTQGFLLCTVPFVSRVSLYLTCTPLIVYHLFLKKLFISICNTKFCFAFSNIIWFCWFDSSPFPSTWLLLNTRNSNLYLAFIFFNVSSVSSNIPCTPAYSILNSEHILAWTVCFSSPGSS